MADIGASNHSQTDASNTTAPPDGMPENQPPGTVNDWARAFIGAVKRWYVWTIPATTAGTTTAYTLTYTVAPGALVDGMSHQVLFNATCGASPTLNINSLSAKPIHKFNSAGTWVVCASGDLLANSIHRVSYHLSSDTYRITASSSPIASVILGMLASLTGAINEAQGSDIASATSTPIGAATGNYVKVTGTTTITSFDTVQAGTRREVTFTGALTLTHNATTLILPGAANITTIAGDVATFVSEGSGNWRCLKYQRSVYTPGGGQFVSVITGAVATGTTTIPFDDTIPQNTEGDQYMTLAITPKSASSTLVITVVAHLASVTASAKHVMGALFQDSTANALAAMLQRQEVDSQITPLTITYVMTSGTTSATTFKFRAGANVAGTTTFNGTVGSRYMGGVLASSMTIEERMP